MCGFVVFLFKIKSNYFLQKSRKFDKKRHKVPKKGLKNENKRNICVDFGEKGAIIKSQKQMFVICSEVIFMTTFASLQIVFMLTLILVGAYTIFREKDLIKFERKVKKYVKSFFKALYLTVQEKKNSKVNTKVEDIRSAQYNEEYAQMLANINKASKIEDVLVA